MKLVFGFEDIPYAVSSPQILPSVRKRLPKNLSMSQLSYGQGKTTGQVASELEEKYHIVETFFNMERDSISDDFEGIYHENLELGVGGGGKRATLDPKKLEDKFRRNLSQRKYDGLIPGVPTTASLRGVSHLRQHPYAQRASRPSFINTSLYQRSFRVWTED